MFGKNQWCSGLPPGLVFPLSSSVCGTMLDFFFRELNFVPCRVGIFPHYSHVLWEGSK